MIQAASVVKWVSKQTVGPFLFCNWKPDFHDLLEGYPNGKGLFNKTGSVVFSL